MFIGHEPGCADSVSRGVVAVGSRSTGAIFDDLGGIFIEGARNGHPVKGSTRAIVQEDISASISINPTSEGANAGNPRFQIRETRSI